MKIFRQKSADQKITERKTVQRDNEDASAENYSVRTALFAVDALRGATTEFVVVLLVLTTLVKVLDDDADEHVEHEKTDQQQERYEIKQAPLVVIDLRLNIYNNMAPTTSTLYHCHRYNTCIGLNTVYSLQLIVKYCLEIEDQGQHFTN